MFYVCCWCNLLYCFYLPIICVSFYSYCLLHLRHGKIMYNVSCSSRREERYRRAMRLLRTSSSSTGLSYGVSLTITLGKKLTLLPPRFFGRSFYSSLCGWSVSLSQPKYYPNFSETILYSPKLYLGYIIVYVVYSSHSPVSPQLIYGQGRRHSWSLMCTCNCYYLTTWKKLFFIVKLSWQ